MGDAMSALLMQKRFTNGADREMVIRKYDEFFSTFCKETESVSFSKRIWAINGAIDQSTGWGIQEVTDLVAVLLPLSVCRTLRLTGQRLGDEGMSNLQLVRGCKLYSVRGCVLQSVRGCILQSVRGCILQSVWAMG